MLKSLLFASSNLSNRAMAFLLKISNSIKQAFRDILLLRYQSLLAYCLRLFTKHSEQTLRGHTFTVHVYVSDVRMHYHVKNTLSHLKMCHICSMSLRSSRFCKWNHCGVKRRKYKGHTDATLTKFFSSMRKLDKLLNSKIRIQNPLKIHIDCWDATGMKREFTSNLLGWHGVAWHKIRFWFLFFPIANLMHRKPTVNKRETLKILLFPV